MKVTRLLGCPVREIFHNSRRVTHWCCLLYFYNCIILYISSNKIDNQMTRCWRNAHLLRQAFLIPGRIDCYGGLFRCRKSPLGSLHWGLLREKWCADKLLASHTSRSQKINCRGLLTYLPTYLPSITPSFLFLYSTKSLTPHAAVKNRTQGNRDFTGGKSLNASETILIFYNVITLKKIMFNFKLLNWKHIDNFIRSLDLTPDVPITS